MNLYGAGGHAKVIIDILKSQGKEINAIFDEDENIQELLGFRVLNPKVIASPIIISIGNNKKRKRIVDKINVEYGVAIHTSSIISKTATIGLGTVVMQGAIIQTGTTIGRHCIVNTGATVDHCCELQDFVHISPNATLCGDVFIGEGTLIGAGSVVLPNIRIGKWSIIGAGSVVTKNIPDNVVAYGNYCKIIRKLKD